MSTEILIAFAELTHKYGSPLSLGEDDPSFNSYIEYRFEEAGNVVPLGVNVGRVAFGAHVIENIPLIVEVTLLNESFGLMENTEHGYLCSTIDVTANKFDGVTHTRPFDVSFDVYTKGVVTTTYLEEDREELTTDPSLFYAAVGIESLVDLTPENILDKPLTVNQVVDLREFVASSFVERI